MAKNFIATPSDVFATGFVIAHKTEYQTQIMERFNAPAMKDVYFINVAPKASKVRVFLDPNEATAALAAAGAKGKVYCNGEYMSVAAAAKLDLQCFSNKQEGKAPGRLQLMTAEEAARRSAPTPKAEGAAAKPVDNTPNSDKPLF